MTNIGGWNIMDNNQVYILGLELTKVNFAMTFLTSFISMGLYAWLSME
jgi:hypothetical protein